MRTSINNRREQVQFLYYNLSYYCAIAYLVFSSSPSTNISDIRPAFIVATVADIKCNTTRMYFSRNSKSLYRAQYTNSILLSLCGQLQ